MGNILLLSSGVQQLRGAPYVAPGGGDPEAPTISNVTGTVTTGQTLTITGTKLQNEDKTNWESDLQSGEDGFEGTFATPQTSDGWDSGGDEYSTSVFLMGSQSLHWQRTGAGPQSNTIYRNASSTTDKGMFCRLYLRCDFSTVGDGSFANDSDKIMLWYGGGANSNNYNFREVTSGPYTEVGLLLDGMGWEYGNIPGGGLQENKWYCHEIEIPAASPWNWRVWINGEAVTGLNPLAGLGNPAQSPWDCTWEENTHHNSNANFGFDKYLDGCVVSTSRVYPACLVEIGDSSDYVTANKVYQWPQFISDASVQVECDITGITATHLWVTNGRNLRSGAYTL